MRKRGLIAICILIISVTIIQANSIAQYNFNLSYQNDATIILNSIIRNPSMILQINTDKPASCRYSLTKNTPYELMTGTFDQVYETTHKKTITGLSDGIYKYYIRCKDINGIESYELEAVFSVNLPVSAQIILPKGSLVKAGTIEIKVITSKVVSSPPSLSYSFDGIIYNPIPLLGSGTIWTGYLIIPEYSKKEVGSFKFQAKDLEGNIGNEIISGGVFIVDTIKPDIIRDIKAEGYEGKIELSWYFDDSEDLDKFKIYRSTSQGVGILDLYKTTENNYFTDTYVERGKTYFYRISAVDKAGNEGDLSPEVYATVLMQNVTLTNKGLELRFFGLVDNMLSEIKTVIDSGKLNKEVLENKNEKEKTIYYDLKLSREIDNALNELNSLSNEVSNLKSQGLTREELDSKLNSARLKLNTIKKKIPESIIILSEKSYIVEINENLISRSILEIMPDISEESLKETIKESLNLIANNKVKIKREAYNLKVTYLDGTSKDISLIKEKIEPQLQLDQNISIIEFIPNNIINNIREIDVKNINYNPIKEEGIISFPSDTKEIIYSISRNFDLNYIDGIRTVIINKKESTKRGLLSLTGYIVFLQNESEEINGPIYFGFFIGAILIISMIIYLNYIRNKNHSKKRINEILSKIETANKEIREKNFESAKSIYCSLSSDYKNLNYKEKIKIYDKLNELYSNLNNMGSI